MCWFLRSNYYFINILIDSYCGHSSAVCRLKSSFVKNKIFRSVVVLVASPMNVYNLVFNTVFTFALFWLLWHLKPPILSITNRWLDETMIPEKGRNLYMTTLLHPTQENVNDIYENQNEICYVCLYCDKNELCCYYKSYHPTTTPRKISVIMTGTVGKLRNHVIFAISVDVMIPISIIMKPSRKGKIANFENVKKN